MLKEHVDVAGKTEVGHVGVLACLKSTWVWLEGLKWDTWRYSLA